MISSSETQQGWDKERKKKAKKNFEKKFVHQKSKNQKFKLHSFSYCEPKKPTPSMMKLGENKLKDDYEIHQLKTLKYMA